MPPGGSAGLRDLYILTSGYAKGSRSFVIMKSPVRLHQAHFTVTTEIPAKKVSEHLTNMNELNHKTPLQGRIVVPLYRLGNRGREILSDLLTQESYHRVQNRIQVIQLPEPLPFLYLNHKTISSCLAVSVMQRYWVCVCIFIWHVCSLWFGMRVSQLFIFIIFNKQEVLSKSDKVDQYQLCHMVTLSIRKFQT